MRIAVLLGGLTLALSRPSTAQDFQKDIAPILEKNCTSCHHGAGAAGQLDLTSRDAVFNQKAVVPGNPDASSLYTSIKSGAMPPGGKLDPPEVDTIARWIKVGADWPQNTVLSVPAKTAKATTPEAELANVKLIRQHIASNTGAKHDAQYTVSIPNTTISFPMVSIPAGKFSMGAADSDPSHKSDEQPVHEVSIDPFWMQAHEVTWDEYRLFMFAKQAGESRRERRARWMP